MTLVIKNPPANAGDVRDVGSIAGSGRSPGGKGHSLHYSGLENSIAHGVAKSQTQLSDFHFHFFKVVITFTGGSVVKNMPANTGVTGSIPGLGRSLEEEMAIHSRILARIIPWREEPGNLQSMES